MRIIVLMLLVTVISACTNQDNEIHNLNESQDNTENIEHEYTQSYIFEILQDGSDGKIDQAIEKVNKIVGSELNEALLGVLLHWHENGEDLEIVQRLLDRGADPNTLDDDGNPVMYIARTSDMLKVLGEDERANFNVKHKGGYTLLIQAVGQWDEPEKVDYLLRKGVDPNEKGTNIHGEIDIPLHIAIQWEDHTDDFEVVKRLLEEPEIDLSIKNGQGMTPLEYAQHLEKNDEIVDYLKKHMERDDSPPDTPPSVLHDSVFEMDENSHLEANILLN